MALLSGNCKSYTRVNGNVIKVDISAVCACNCGICGEDNRTRPLSEDTSRHIPVAIHRDGSRVGGERAASLNSQRVQTPRARARNRNHRCRHPRTHRHRSTVDTSRGTRDCAAIVRDGARVR